MSLKVSLKAQRKIICKRQTVVNSLEIIYLRSRKQDEDNGNLRQLKSQVDHSSVSFQTITKMSAIAHVSIRWWRFIILEN